MSGELEKGLKTVLTGTASCYSRLPRTPTFPLVLYQRVYTNREHAIDGSSAGVTEAGIQIDCIADTYEAAKILADSVRVLLNGYSGTWGTLTAQFVKLETENDLYDGVGDNITHWVSQRYQVWTNMD